MSSGNLEVSRWHFVAIATGTYRHPPWDTEPLEGVRREVAAFRSWLCPIDRPRRVPTFSDSLAELAENPTLADIESSLKNPAAFHRFRDDDAVVLYVTGHGYIADNTHWIVLNDTEFNRPAATALRSADLIAWLKETQLKHLLILFDLCHAAQVTTDMRFDEDVPATWAGLASTAKGDLAGVEVLSRALSAFMESLSAGQVYGVDEPFLTYESFVSALQRGLQAEGQALYQLFGRVQTGPHICLPNPHYAPQPGVVMQASLRDLALPSYWQSHARGVGDVSNPGWFFTGRVELMAELVRFASGSPGTLLVTGAAGTGKSAALARLVTLSDRSFCDEYRSEVDALPADQRPGLGGIDVALLLNGKHPVDVLRQICVVLNIPHKPDADMDDLWNAWHSWLSQPRLLPVTIVMDGLDEAVNPYAMLRGLIERLDETESPRTRLILGVRSPGGEGDWRNPTLADMAEHQIRARRLRVDEAPLWNDNDMIVYASQILGETPGSPYVGPEHRQRREAMANEIAARAHRSFLVARMTASELACRREIVSLDDSGWLAAIGDGVPGVFRRDLHATFTTAEDRMRAVDLLQAVAFAVGPGLPWGEIWPAMANAIADRMGHDEYTNADIAWLLSNRIGGYLLTARSDDVTVYHLFHKELSDALRTDRTWLLTSPSSAA